MNTFVIFNLFHSRNLRCSLSSLSNYSTFKEYKKKYLVTSDMIGPPNNDSNLRKIEFYIPPNETVLQRKYRKLRTEVQEWNQQFWSNHNKKFLREREAFIELKLPAGKTTLTADEMSVFYKTFLDKNWKLHTTYNIEWYKRNINILVLSMQVGLETIYNRFKL